MESNSPSPLGAGQRNHEKKRQRRPCKSVGRVLRNRRTLVTVLAVASAIARFIRSIFDLFDGS
jgi:hypothetical protein